MKIAVMGTGGVGAYYGGLLAQVGHDVTFVARGAHLDAICRNGLQIKSVHGDFMVRPAQATSRPAEIGLADLVLFCTKSYDTQSAAHSILPVIGEQTVVVSLQNGIDSAEQIGAVLGMNAMLGGVTWISAAIEAPGVVKQASQFRRIVIGEFDGQVTPRVRSILAAFDGTGALVELSDNISKVLWTKFVFISAVSGLGALTRLPIGEYRSVAETRGVLISLMREIEMVARAYSIQLDADVVEKTLAFVDNAEARIKPSMQLDVENGRRFELEALIGAVCRKGRERSVPTPVTDWVYAALLPGAVKVSA